MNVNEVAVQLGVTPRRVRAMIADGRIVAHRAGQVWVIDEVSAARAHRPLSTRSWNLLAQALKTRTLEGLHGQERRRTAARIRQLRESDHPARVLADWIPSAPDDDLFMSALASQAREGNDDRIRAAVRRGREYLRDRGDLAAVVTAERVVRGHDTRGLADAAGVPKQTVLDIEAGRPLSSPGQVRRVLRALDIEPTALPDMALT